MVPVADYILPPDGEASVKLELGAMGYRARAPRFVEDPIGISQGVEVRVRTGCPRAEAAHRRARRQYAHANHVPGVVCVARAFWTLPKAHQRGLLLHELGHLALGRRPHTEAEADREARRRYGVRIRYRDSRWGKRLQYV